ncbi:MAG: menaquinone biosynthesis protein [Acidobacteriota bacterium]
MTPLRISVVDFLNARPLTWGLLHEPSADVQVSRDTPSACAAKLASGEVDAGLIPSIEYQRIPGLKVVPGLGIAASSEVRSVLLVSDVSREKIRSVSLDPASRTSAALTRILLKRVYGLEPEYRDGPSDARLVIGDPALKTRLNGHVVLDLAALWRSYSGHPFVFAFWAIRSPAASPELVALLRRSFDAGLAHFGAMVREEAAASGLSAAVVEDYLRHALHFELDAGDRDGLRLFYRLAAEDGLIERAREIDYTPAP